MSRLSPFAGALLVLGCMGSVASAADYFNNVDGMDGFRGSFGDDWQAESPVEFEAGIRYWYAMGSQQLSAGGGNYSAEDTSHILEGFLRIDDNSTSTYLKGNAGYAIAIDGTYSTPASGGAQTMNGGEIGYAGADLGYQPFGSDAFKLGGFVGYQYLTDNPDIGRQNYLNSGGGVNSDVNSFDINSLRLGASAHAELGDLVDIDAEAALIPYAQVYGRYGAFYQPAYVSGGNTYVQGSYGTLNGRMYGAAGEVTVGVHPTENLTLQLGGRAYYMTGEATMEVRNRRFPGGGSPQDVVYNTSNLEFLRYGVTAGLAARF